MSGTGCVTHGTVQGRPEEPLGCFESGQGIVHVRPKTYCTNFSALVAAELGLRVDARRSLSDPYGIGLRSAARGLAERQL